MMGYAISSAGDVNGDGMDDVILGAPRSRQNRGDTYVVFGTGANFKGTANDQPLYVAVVVPEPTALSLLLLGGLAAFRRR